jgi:hypothetical protein
VGLGTVTAACLLAATGASATFHLMKIREVSSGTGTPNTSYIEVQMYAPFQNFLSNGAKLAVCNSDCSLLPAEFSPFSDVANGNSQDTVLFGDSGIPSGSKDFDVNLDLPPAGGAACYISEPGYSDCVSWGNFSNNASLMSHFGASADPGSPAAALSSGMALRRSIAAGCPTLLEASDDTNNSAADFSLTTPNPRKNSVTPTEAPCPGMGGGGPTGYPPPGPSGSTPTKKKKCKKHKHRSAQVSKKKCKKHK